MAPVLCCVGGCKSTSETHRLYNLPKIDKLRSLWLDVLVPRNSSLIILSKEQLIRKKVCQLHFEPSQIDCDGKRIRYGVPTLFTEAEILHKVPLGASDEKGERPEDDIPVMKTGSGNVKFLPNISRKLLKKRSLQPSRSMKAKKSKEVMQNIQNIAAKQCDEPLVKRLQEARDIDKSILKFFVIFNFVKRTRKNETQHSIDQINGLRSLFWKNANLGYAFHIRCNE